MCTAEMTVPLTHLSLAQEIDNTIDNVKKCNAELFKHKEISRKFDEFINHSRTHRNNRDLFIRKIRELKLHLTEYANAIKTLNKFHEEENQCHVQIKKCQLKLQTILIKENLKAHCAKLGLIKDDLNESILMQKYDECLYLLMSHIYSVDDFSLEKLDMYKINIQNSENLQNILAIYIITLKDIYQIIARHLWDHYIIFNMNMHEGTIIMKTYDSENNTNSEIGPHTILFYTIFKILINIENYGKFKQSLSEYHSNGLKSLLILEPLKTFTINILKQFVDPLFVHNSPDVGNLNSKIIPDTKEFNNPLIKLEYNKMSVTPKAIFYESFSMKVQAMLKDIKAIFTFLQDHLDSSSCHEKMLFANDNYKNNTMDSRTWFNTLKKYLLDCIFHQYINPFYKSNIPRSIEQLIDYQDSLKYLKTFEEDMKPLEAEEEPSHYHTDSIRSFLDDNFASKMQEDILTQGRECLLKNMLHKTITADSAKFDIPMYITNEEHTNLSELIDKHVKDSLCLDLKIEEFIPRQSTLFSDCQISESIAQFKDLVCKTVQPLFLDKRTLNDKYSGIIYETISKLFHLYATLAPMREKGENLNVPLFAALSLNNSCYVAQFLSLLQTALFTIQNQNFPFKEATNSTIYLQPILNIGYETFTSHLNFQTDLINEMLQGYFAVSHNDKSIEPDAKHLKRFCNHLLNLQKIWEPCLPEYVTKKAIGLLLDRGVGNIINHILEMDDISKESCDNYNEQLSGLQAILSSSFTVMVKNKVNTSVIDFCPSWPKFIGLLQILSLPMQDIAQLWSQNPSNFEGKADPNGVNRFSAAELRHMIRAIFQNTENRMGILGKIC